MARKKVFISFDFHRDKHLRNLMLAQASLRHSPLRMIDKSLHEESPEANWPEQAAKQIRDSDLVMVVVGPQTYKAPGVRREVIIARRLGKPVVQVKSRGSKARTLPKSQVIAWRWEDLKKVLRNLPPKRKPSRTSRPTTVADRAA